MQFVEGTSAKEPHTAHPADVLLSKLFLFSPAFPAGEAVALVNRWHAERHPDERLAAFLVRGGFMSETAADMLGRLSSDHLTVGDSELRLRDYDLRSLRFAESFFSPVESSRFQNDRAELRVSEIPVPAFAFAESLALGGRRPAPGVGDSSKTGDMSDPPPAPSSARIFDAAEETWSGERDADPFVGETLGDYRLLTLLGRGGRGWVYEAEDVLLGRRVAIKVLRPELVAPGSTALRRFLLEARAASKLDHPNCVGVQSIGKKDGVVFFVMPLVKGRSAQDALETSGAFPAVAATRITLLAARGLAAAHALGMVHRDIKPANIVLGENNEVRVADFGLAKATDDAIAGLTEPGRWMGTPHYMSPEQCRGNEVDFRADVYSLGATYYALLTGRPPFADSSPMAVVYRQVSEPHPDPSTILPTIPKVCVEIIDRAMAKDPADRYQTAGEMEAALLEAGRRLYKHAHTPPPSQDAPVSADAPTHVPGKSAPHETVAAKAEHVAKGDHAPKVGAMLGKCLLTELIGKGGTALVFRALHKTLNIQVAVKVLPPDKAFHAILKNEARLLAKLDHPRIVRVLDFDDEGSRPYLILEYVEGLSLADLIAQSGRLRPDRAVGIAVQTAEALAAAQAFGLIHRDVKPANILLTRDGSTKLADLGLALARDKHFRQAGGLKSSDENVGTGTLAGTAAYMSPEQAADKGAIDHRADIYSLGATLYQALVGHSPFSGSRLMETLRRHRDEAPVPPKQLVPELPQALSDVVLRMLAKNPADRYGNYSDLTTALTSSQNPIPTGEARPSRTVLSRLVSVFRRDKPS